MEIFSMQFLYALGAIILIDLVLAGDNAIVIALAARNLPAHLRSRAIVWGTVGAIVVRALMTVAVVWLLRVPGLLLAGGALLVWIAVKLLAPPDSGDGGEHSGVTSFWGAMRTIVIADAVMGLDNVLAVAGAAHGSYLLVVLGLVISIPIVVWGSHIILHWIERFPVIVYAGAAVLAGTAVKMMLSEPLAKSWIDPWRDWSWLAYVAMIAAVLGAGYALNRRNKSRSESAAIEVSPLVPSAVQPEVSAMQSTTLVPAAADVQPILIPVSDSAASRAAVAQLIAHTPRGSVKVHLAHVTPAIHRHISRFLPQGTRARFDRERVAGAVEPAERMLREAGFAAETHVVRSRDLVGALVRLADDLACERIIVGSSKKSGLVRFLTWSITGRLLERANVPVEVVLHGAPSLLTRYGLPAGVGALIAALAID